MTLYLVIAYRWGNTNNHWYIVYCGDDHGKAVALADHERQGRGGKYGVGVYEITERGEGMELKEYYPSGDEEEPFTNWRIEMIERLGHELLRYAEGTVHVPDPERPGFLKLERVEPIPMLVQMVAHAEANARNMSAAMEKARTEARLRSQRVWCPICDCTPVYVIEYSCSFWRVARQPTSGELQVDELEGTWCPSCQTLHLQPEQVSRNHHKIWRARMKADTAELDEEDK